jgi:NAD(P)H-quinone oxidoreductase subunit 5
MFLGGKAHGRLSLCEGWELSLRMDSLSAVVLVLVSFLVAVVVRFSLNYLSGDPGQGRFMRWLCLTGSAVLFLVLSGNLAQLALAWGATSLFLHKLLVFYPERAGALLAARKKFLISRAGDACLLGALWMIHSLLGTLDIERIFALLAPGRHTMEFLAEDPRLDLACLLLVAAAMLKSAQFPFHSWLPDTMETPTPVSALMHAGIINAGGFLVMRMAPMVSQSSVALTMLAVGGAATALVASVVMLTQASIKRWLAFSTVAQMGFMMLQCGLGAFGLALLHLTAHSLYKAHAFLSSGSLVRIARSAWEPEGQPRAHPGILALAFATASGFAATAGFWLGHGRAWTFGEPVLIATFAMALTYGLWSLWSRTFNGMSLLIGLASGAGLTLAYFGLHAVFAPLVPHPALAWDAPLLQWLIAGAVLALFLLIMGLQMSLSISGGRALQALYVHARNGFYINTLANRLAAALWPGRSVIATA